MIPLICVVAVIVFIVAIFRAGQWAALNSDILALVLLILGFVTLYTYHRRRMAAINEMEYEKRGRFRRVSFYQRWPKYCAWCGGLVSNARMAHIHNEPDSPCSLVVLGADRQAAEPPPEVDAAPAASASWTATVVHQAAGLDTFTDDPEQLEAAGDE